MGTAKKPAKGKGKSVPATRKKKAARATSAKDALLARIATALGVTPEQAELRALSELAERLDAQPPRETEDTPAEPVAGLARTPRPPSGPLPQRLFLQLDGRGLDGVGLPLEVIDQPTLVGSARTKCTVWVNAPRIESQHLRIWQDEGDWVLEDLNTEHGTFLGEHQIRRHILSDGDEFRLAGYLRMRVELR